MNWGKWDRNEDQHLVNYTTDIATELFARVVRNRSTSGVYHILNKFFEMTEKVVYKEKYNPNDKGEIDRPKDIYEIIYQLMEDREMAQVS